MSRPNIWVHWAGGKQGFADASVALDCLKVLGHPHGIGIESGIDEIGTGVDHKNFLTAEIIYGLEWFVKQSTLRIQKEPFYSSF